MKINNKKELQNIEINGSADFDYKDFIKIYRECTKEPYSFLTIDTILPAGDLLRYRKSLLISYKNDSNWSILSWKDLVDKNECLTGGDLGHKLSVF